MIKDAIVKEILQDFAQKRNKAIYLADQNKQKAYQISTFADLDKTVRELNFEIGKLKFLEKDYSNQEKKLQFVKKQEELLLKSYNMNLFDLEPKFDCKKCEDKGIINGTEYCTCFRQALSNKLMQKAGINLQNVPTLDKYDYSYFPKAEQNNVIKAVSILKDYIENFKINKIKNFLFVGGTGAGKSYLAQSLAKGLIAKNYTVLFISSYNLNTKFLSEYLTKIEDNSSVLEDLIDYDVLFIDDLGTEQIKNNVTKEYLLLLLNERSIRNKATIVTTNLLPNEIEDRYGERIYSRIFNKDLCVTIRLNNDDMRLKSKCAEK